MVNKDVIKQYVVLFCAEFIGTAILLYIGCLGTVLEKYAPLQPIVVASTFGLAIMASIQAIGHISGPHINPGISLGIFILNKITWRKLLVYLAAQYTGALFGYGMLWVQMPASSVHLKPCALFIHPGLTAVKVFFLEFTSSLVLFLVIGGAVDLSNKDHDDSIAVRLGFIIYGLVVAIGELSGACLNSARALPPAIFTNTYDSHWAFHLGPLLGQCTGALLYKFVFDSSDKWSLNRNTNQDEEL